MPISDEEFEKERCSIMQGYGGANRWAYDAVKAGSSGEQIAELKASIDSFRACFSPVKRPAEVEASKKRKAGVPKYPPPNKYYRGE